MTLLQKCHVPVGMTLSPLKGVVWVEEEDMTLGRAGFGVAWTFCCGFTGRLGGVRERGWGVAVAIGREGVIVPSSCS